MYSFATPPIKLRLGQQIGGGLLITNHLDQSLWWANQKHWEAVRSYLVHSFLQVHSAAETFTSHCNLYHCTEPNLFSESNRHMLDFLHALLLCRVTYWAPLEMLLGSKCKNPAPATRPTCVDERVVIYLCLSSCKLVILFAWCLWSLNTGGGKCKARLSYCFILNPLFWKPTSLSPSVCFFSFFSFFQFCDVAQSDGRP